MLFAGTALDEKSGCISTVIGCDPESNHQRVHPSMLMDMRQIVQFFFTLIAMPLSFGLKQSFKESTRVFSNTVYVGL